MSKILGNVASDPCGVFNDDDEVEGFGCASSSLGACGASDDWVDSSVLAPVSSLSGPTDVEKGGVGGNSDCLLGDAECLQGDTEVLDGDVLTVVSSISKCLKSALDFLLPWPFCRMCVLRWFNEP